MALHLFFTKKEFLCLVYRYGRMVSAENLKSAKHFKNNNLFVNIQDLYFPQAIYDSEPSEQ